MIIDIAFLLAVVTAILFLCKTLKIPSIVGLLLIGVILGPHFLGFIKNAKEVDLLAEIGIIFLLFTIGLEFSISKLIKLRIEALVGGGLQVVITIVIVSFCAHFFGVSLEISIFSGCLVALSSTAICLKMLQTKGEIATRSGRLVLGIVIFQDMATILMILFLPFLAGTSNHTTPALISIILRSLSVIVLLFVSSKWIIPKFLYKIAKQRDQELFLVVILFLCFGVVAVFHYAGLPLSLGAFFAGLIIAESDYSHEALSGILPFKETFAGFFFISVGMLLNLSFISENWLLLFGLVFLIIILKILITSFAGFCSGQSLSNSLRAGFYLAQVGEFAFIFALSGLGVGLFEQRTYQLFLTISAITMLVSPILFYFGGKISLFLNDIKLPQKLQTGMFFNFSKIDNSKQELVNHVIIVGFGYSGRQLALSLEDRNIPYVVLETNPDTVRVEKKNGRRIFFGNAASLPVLENVNFKKARMVVLSIPDPVATNQIVHLMRQLSPTVFLIARTPYASFSENLYIAGANIVVVNEIVASMEILLHVLSYFQVPTLELNSFIDSIRNANFMLSSPRKHDVNMLFGLTLPDIALRQVMIAKSSKLAGNTLSNSCLRAQHKVTVLAILRGGTTIFAPQASEILNAGDILMIAGEISCIKLVQKIIETAQND